MSTQYQTIESDILVIGSGIAGLVFALLAGEHGKVQLITKKDSFESNTNYAQGGIACVLDREDTFESHIEDTLKAGAGLCKKDVVKVLVEEGPVMVKQLIQWGAEFTMDPQDHNLALGREGGHSRRRIIHAKDLTGREVERALLVALRNKPNVRLHENCLGVELITTGHGTQRRCIGAIALDTIQNKIINYMARAVVLASGGTGQVYLHTTNPEIATGDGVAMAYRQGAQIANMEFIQFHPTSFYNPEGNTFLISEAVRGEGASLTTLDHVPFMDKYDPMGNLAARDIVARAIDNEMKNSGAPHVLLDTTEMGADFFGERFPYITERCLEHGIDPRREPIPVVPAAHYSCGGVLTDLNGESTLPGLFATGEVACTGVHGANRLASNSLLEALVFSRRAFDFLNTHSTAYPRPELDSTEWNVQKYICPSDDRSASVPEMSHLYEAHCRDEIRRNMWDYVGIVRTDDRLKLAERRIELVRGELQQYIKNRTLSRELIELWNLADTAWLIIRSALTRKESRGLNYNTDYPKTDNSGWLKDTLLEKPV